MELTLRQLDWLISMGDRGPEDVYYDEEGLFVLMFSPTEPANEVKVYLPTYTQVE